MTGRFVACGQPVGNLLVPSREILPKDLTDRLRAYVGRLYPWAVVLIEPGPFSLFFPYFPLGTPISRPFIIGF
jgi:hypothetical protein